MTTYSCGEPHIIYNNQTGTAQTIRVTVTDNCGGGQSTLIVSDMNGDPVQDALLSAPGGVATLNVGQDQRVTLMCDGADGSQQGCTVYIAFV